MDCELAREQLDVIHPDRSEQANPDVQEAAAHVEHCCSCSELVESRRAFDREFGRVLRQVPVPPGLRSRLVLAVSEAGTSESVTQRPQPQLALQRGGRRRWAILLTTTTVGLLLVLGGWKVFSRGAPPVLALDVVRNWCGDHLHNLNDIQALPALSDGLSPTLTDGRWAALVSSTPPRGADIDGDGVQDAAVYTLSPGAFLVVMGPDRIGAPPKTWSEFYTPVVHAAWTVGNQVYVVVVPNRNVHDGRQQLKELQNRVYGSVS